MQGSNCAQEIELKGRLKGFKDALKLARSVKGYRLHARLVVHAVAPRYLVGSEQEQATLRQTYMSVFEHSELADCKRIVFPALGVGIYRWPITLAAEIALSALADSPFEETIVCLYDDENFYAYKNLI